MTKLRHAGSPVGTCESLSRAKETGILLEVVIAARIERRRLGHRTGPTINDEVSELREALRLDDPVLDDLIAQGRHRGPWISEVSA